MTEKLCRFFVMGKCKKGDTCDHCHVKDVCRDFFQHGECPRRGKCRFQHITHKGKEIIKGKNTETFEPSFLPPKMKLRTLLSSDKLDITPQPNDVLLIPNIFDSQKDYYGLLLKEIKSSGVPEEDLWKLWHGDTHLIADDKLNWKEKCPVFNEVIQKLKDYFDVDVQATRFNWYRGEEWKPYHHDAAGIDPHKAEKQNITIAASFGATRDIAFQHAKTSDPIDNRATISIPQPNGWVYTFGNQVNLDWRHGVPPVEKSNSEKSSNPPLGAENQDPPPGTEDLGRISIIIWGKNLTNYKIDL